MSSSPSPSKNKPEIDKSVVFEQFTNSCIKQRFVELCEKLNITPQTSLQSENERFNDIRSTHSPVTIESKIERQHNLPEERDLPGSKQVSSRKRTIEDSDEHWGGSND
jgi:hypothetical protein